MPQPQEGATNTDASLENLIPEYKTLSNLRVIKNLVVLSVGCLLAFCAYDGLVMLQSTLNQDGGIGVISVAVQFGFSCITALLLPEYLFEKIGCKSVITICLVLFVPYIASNFYPHWSLMIPASILIGLANSLYWAAQSAYLNHLSILYSWNSKFNKIVASIERGTESAEKTVCQEMGTNAQFPNESKRDDNILLNTDFEKISANNQSNLKEKIERNLHECIKAPRNVEDFVKKVPISSIKSVSTKSDQKMSELLASTTARFFGVHGLIYQTCHVWGNLLSYYVLRIGAVEDEMGVSNTSCHCGFDFCNFQTNCSTNNLREPREDLRNLLTGIFVAISVLAVIFILFGLDEVKNRKKNVTISWKYIAATCNQIKDKRQLLLIPMSLNIGVMQGFVMGDFTKDYVACAWRVHHVGLVTACLGATLALSSSVSGCLVKHLGRRTIFLAAKGLNIAAVIAMYLWKPTSSETYMFFIVSGMLGAVMGTFWSQLRGEGAFSFYFQHRRVRKSFKF
ncbi:unnamed protein product [Larinioides sclopetarius]|uniref:Uncharacterized protein n=1 Tax=Larinioides sclopetarius TaxID=280406 RepID=A0AAV2B9S2_9ARAC